MTDFIKGEAQALAKRGLSEESCRKYGYIVGSDKHGNPCQVANYRRDGQIVAQKIRYPDKSFKFIGDAKECGLFGQHLWQPGRRVVVTEGEIDAVTVAQVLNLKWAVVSVPNGAQGAKKALSKEIEWLERFDEVVLMFDMDEPGRAAAQECVEIFSPGKCRIAELPMKDPNELLQAGKGEAIVQAIYDAKTHRPDGLVTFGDTRERAITPIPQGLPWPWPSITKETYGRRYGEVYGFGAGTGVGKTDVFTQVIEYTAVALNEKCGLFYLEQPPGETAKRIAGKHAGKRFHIPDDSWDEADLMEAFDTIADTGNIFLYDNFGSTDWDVIRAKMKYLVLNEGVKHIFLDHLTALAAEEEDEKQAIETIMAQIAKFANEMNVCFYFISHLATPEGKPHEEGGRVMIRHFKGSRAIGFWSHFMFGLERDQQADDPRTRSTTIWRFLKDRLSGQSVGKTQPLLYDAETGLLNETTIEADCPFGDDEDGAPQDF